jgi:hypothetical protein
MILGIDDIVPEALHKKVGWDIRHHFMAEKIVDQFALVLPRDRELIRQVAVVYVLEGRTKPPEADPADCPNIVAFPGDAGLPFPARARLARAR